MGQTEPHLSVSAPGRLTHDVIAPRRALALTAVPVGAHTETPRGLPARGQHREHYSPGRGGARQP
jgi:hypothetical protein